ncbi:MAG: MFS transporter [Chloroflexi bacterium]|nr:MFS transporter [Chloroflexota bacterium]MBI5715990.1 MFS transporter [Chloroflexota bacterium]
MTTQTHPLQDSILLFSTRIARLFAYGSVSVILVLYLAQVGLSESQIGLLLTFTLIGDTAISLWLTTNADRIGRKRMLIVGAGLMIFAGILFGLTNNIVLLFVAATIGVISPSGSEVGPFLSIEQAALSQSIPNEKRTGVFAWYNLVGFFATALGSLISGGLTQTLQSSGMPPLESYRIIVFSYSGIGVLLIALFTFLSPAVESIHTNNNIKTTLGLHQSRNIVFKLSALFALDSFAGGFIVQSIMAYWFFVRFNVSPALLGGIFFGANILSGFSSLGAARIAARFGLINTMVWTHIPSNILLIFVPLMPNLPLAIFVLLIRHTVSQMDVPTRQSYTMAVVSPDERSAAAGVTGVARTIGASISPMITGLIITNPMLLGVPFFLAGGLKIVYDLSLYFQFRSLKE